MQKISLNRPEIDPAKVALLGPIPQSSEGDNLEDREFITPEWSKKAIQLLSKQVIGRILKEWGM